MEKSWNCFEISVGILNMTIRGPVVQSVSSLTADPRVASLVLDRSHTFMEIDREITSMVIHFLPLIQDRLLSVTSKSSVYEVRLTT